jgi:hypothetical protein
MEIVAPGEEALQECLGALDEASDEMRVFGTYAPYREPDSDEEPSDDSKPEEEESKEKNRKK